MTLEKKYRPIGIFDSGIGGLTVAQAITNVLPNERIVYFGDTAHLPYGDKSTAAIQAYAVKICDLLIKQNCKVILIACNSASAAAYDLVKEYVGSKAKVLNVIDPIVSYIGRTYPDKTIGLIGTKQTVNSNIYRKKVDELGHNIELKSHATPLLAAMIEEGFFNDSISESVIHAYLSDPDLDNIEALILGCTHYPLIKKQIENYYKGKVDVLDASQIVAQQVKDYLEANNLASDKLVGEHHFYVSDFTRSFEESTRIFFKRQVHLEHYPLWE
ncbi:glutamate racemase [Pontibacter cellulosilyticus]|uniref:Glutamate racemase n=1 Tax=Pontibacter cellulosilyticus TaxID=1720253 RepID=A0A923SJD8_9BACT|nr:glutamate racemase [Pontibacter cellulosilyticus]MBC5992621.1 glutamate racemase [Pontibacter cellulosilyticus]